MAQCLVDIHDWCGPQEATPQVRHRQLSGDHLNGVGRLDQVPLGCLVSSALCQDLAEHSLSQPNLPRRLDGRGHAGGRLQDRSRLIESPRGRQDFPLQPQRPHHVLARVGLRCQVQRLGDKCPGLVVPPLRERELPTGV